MSATMRRPALAPGISPWVRALLLAVLLAAFGAMHTLGHADHGTGSGHGAGTRSGAPAHAVPGGHDGPAAHTVSGAAVEPVPVHAPETAAAPPELDPTSVCPTLTGPGLPLAGMAATAFAPCPGPVAPAATPKALRRVDPPSVAAGNRPLLSDLQVLRI
ncbi:hypothetical protein SUDANB121_00137 [Nocardiopsis dassonvillei]|uniref:DUF6153 family protein n=1 Tax=Nocardiopsis dassonvillei TaxID=2014 RepID=UPI003F5628BC